MLILNTILALALLLDGFITNYVGYSVQNVSLFFPFTFILTITIIYPYFQLKTKEYLISIGIFSIIYGMLYNHIIFLSPSLFLLTALIIILAFRFLSNSMFITTSLAVMMIILYNLLNFTLLKIIGYTYQSYLTFFTGVVRVIPMSIVYGILIYVVLDFLKKKKVINRID